MKFRLLFTLSVYIFMQGVVRLITVGQAAISVFFLVMGVFSLPSELDYIFFLFNVLAGLSSAAFISYTSANPVPGSEESTLLYFYALLSLNCITIVIAFARCRLANRKEYDVANGNVVTGEMLMTEKDRKNQTASAKKEQ